MGEKQSEMSPLAPHLLQCPYDSPSPVSRPSSSLTCHLSAYVSPPSSFTPAMSVTPLYLLPLLFTTFTFTSPPDPPSSPITCPQPSLRSWRSHTPVPSVPPAVTPSCSESQVSVCLPPHPGSPFTNPPVSHPWPLSFPLASPSSRPPHSPVSPGEKPYVCTVPGCGKRFTEYSSLYKHHVVHTHCKPYTCSACGKTYRQTSTLAMHKRSAHGELEATEESEQALYEQQQLDGEGYGQEVRAGTGQASPWPAGGRCQLGLSSPSRLCSRGEPTTQTPPRCLPLGGEGRGQ